MNMVVLRSMLVRVALHSRMLTRAPLANAQIQLTSSTVARWNCRNATRAFSSKGLNGINGLNGEHDDNEWDDEAPANGDVSPFERLLQHSQQFRDEVGMEDLPEGVKEEILGEELRDDESVDEDVHNDDDAEGNQDKDQDFDAVLDEREGHHAEFLSHIHKPHGHHRAPVANKHERPHHGHTRQNKNSKRWSVEQRVRRQIGYAEDVDFEHGLRDLDERRAREKMYLQLLARDYDRDRVCQNCGEHGHVARNCMLPVICSNCGDVGHRRNECPHRSFTVDQLAAIKPEKTGKGPKKSEGQLKAEARRRTELKAIRERHDRMKKAFDSELDEYLEQYESANKARNKSSSEDKD